MSSGMPMNCVTLILDGTREFVLRYGYFRPGFSAAGLQRGPNLAPIVPTLQSGEQAAAPVCVSCWWRPFWGHWLAQRIVGQTPSCPSKSSGFDRPRRLVGIASIGCENKPCRPIVGAMSWELGVNRCAVPCQLTHCLTTPPPPDLYDIALVWKHPRLNVDYN